MKIQGLIMGATVLIASLGAQADCDIEAGKKVFNKCAPATPWSRASI